MSKCKSLLLAVVLLLSYSASAQEYVTPFYHCLLNEAYYDQLVGESSGDRTYNYIMDIAPYERDRKHSDYEGEFFESRYVVEKLKSYGIDNAVTLKLGKTKTWDGVSASLWETSPNSVKIADYQDLAAILAQGSANADVEAELVWIGRGTDKELEGLDLNGKIVVTEASGARVHDKAVAKGAVGVISFNSPRPLVDPLQIPNSGIRSKMLQAIRSGMKSSLDMEHFSLQAFLNAAQNDKAARIVADQVCENIGQALSAVVMLLNPSMIVFGGALSKLDSLLISGVRRVLELNCFAGALQDLKLELARSDEFDTARGAALRMRDKVWLNE